MAQLAIRGHLTRGKEVIEILEMLGGKQTWLINADSVRHYYYINSANELDAISIVDSELNGKYIAFTIEKFLEKFPYKVGDKVLYKIYNVYSSIRKMTWNEEKEQVIYRLDSQRLWVATADELEKRTIKTITIEDFKANSKEWLIDTLESMSKDDALQTICDLHDELHRPKFPTTYEDCCKVLNIIPNNKLVFSNPNEESEYAYCNLALYNSFNKLKICRDAYWKIAGDWKPDVMYCDLYCIGYDGNVITWKMQGGCRLLVFPTSEMRDAFYENFKELIEECKELL
jgi:hypothetical protein